MKVILSENVANLGKMGAEVDVAKGYARNYLLPRKLAVRADSSTAKQIAHEKRIIQRREEKRRTAFAQLAAQIENISLEFKVLAGEDEKIFGSVTSGNIAEKLAELGHSIDRKAIMLEEPIKSLGIFAVPVRLSGDTEANLKIWVSALEKEENG